MLAQLPEFQQYYRDQLTYLSRRRYLALKVCLANADPRCELDVLRRLPNDDGRHVLRLYDCFSSHLMDVLGLLHTGCCWNPRELCRKVPQVHRHGVVHFYPISSIGTDLNGWVTDPHGKILVCPHHNWTKSPRRPH